MALLKFYLLRLAVFLIPFVLYYSVGLGLVFSTIFATITGACLSYLLLNKQRRQAAGVVADRLGKQTEPSLSKENEDNAYEDAMVEMLVHDAK